MNRVRSKTKKVTSLVISILVGVTLIYAGVQNNNQRKIYGNAATGAEYSVHKVVDGDTAEITINGQNKTVRFIGMDTPEVVDPRKTVQCFGREASNRGHELLEGKKVKLEYDSSVGEQDKYGRLLAYIILPDGVNYNQKMIAEGYAHEYTYSNQAYKYQDEFKTAQSNAEAAQLGLWSPNTCGGNTVQAAK